MHLTHDDLVLHYYGESGADAWRADSHLASCGECRAALARLQDTLALVDASEEGEPQEGYEARLWARLQAELEAPQPWWQRLVSGGGARWMLASATAAVAGLAFYAGWHTRDSLAPSSAVTSVAAPNEAPSSAQTSARVLALAVREHLDRAEVTLSEVARSDAHDTTTLLAERLRASDLVATNRLVRQTAAMAGDDALDDVLDELERALVDIANAPDDLSAAEWPALRARIDAQGLLFRLRVLADELRVAPGPRTAPLSKRTTS